VLALLQEISLRHWLRSRGRALLVVLGIALGIGLYVATEAASDRMSSAFNELVTRIAGRADLSITATGVGVPGDIVARVVEIPGVAHAAASVEVSAHAVDLGESLLVLGVDFLGDLHFLPFHVESGERSVIADPLAFVNDPTALLLSQRFAARHGLAAGDRVRLLTADGPKTFHVRGVLRDSGTAAASSGQLAVMFLDAAQVAFARETFVDRVDVAVVPGVDVETVRQRISMLLGSQLQVDRPAQIGTRLKGLVEPMQAALWLSGFLALVVGAFLVYNAVAIGIAQRRREVGILRALGVTRTGAIALFMVETGLLAVPGVCLGLLLGSTLAHYAVGSAVETLNRMYAPVAQIAQALPPSLIVRAAITGPALAMFAAFFPARSGTSLDPATVLKGASAVEISRTPVRPMLLASVLIATLLYLPIFNHSKAGGALQIGFIMIAAALATPAFVLGLRALCVRGVEAALGIPGRLGLDHVGRTLGRSTVNVLALMVAVSMSVSVGGWLGSFERSLTKWAQQVGMADLSVTRGSPVIDRQHVPLSVGTAANVRAVPGVEAVQALRAIEQQAGAVTFRLIATDTDMLIGYGKRRDKGWTFVDGAALQPGDLVRQPSIVISENAARLLHVRAHDSLQLATPKGPVGFLVRGVVVDYTSETGTGFVDLRYFREYWSDTTVDALFVYLAPRANIELVSEHIRAATGGEPDGSAVFVLRTSALEDHVVQMLHRTFSYSRSVEVMTLIIALLGVIGTMLASVLDRRTEVSMLRAVGATRGQVAGAIIVEAAFLGLCAALAGAAVGIVQCRVFLHTLLASATGWHLEFIFPWASAAGSGMLVVITSALAGALPAWLAVHQQIVSPPVGD
jgi:putative ABC transport system permease protein